MTVATIPERTSKVTFKQDVAPWVPQLATLCTRGFTPERILAGALNAGLKNPMIFDCDPKSIFLALAKCARLALDVGEGIDLVPLSNSVKQRDGSYKKILMLEAWTGYRGLKALASRQRIIASMDENCVYQGDEFSYEKGLSEKLRHLPTSAKKRGALAGAYSIIRLPGGTKTFHYMPIEDIEAIRAQSKQWGPEKVPVCPDWYAMKTVVRDYLSRQPQSGALAEALAYDDTADSSDGESTREVVQELTPEQQRERDLEDDRRVRDDEDGS